MLVGSLVGNTLRPSSTVALLLPRACSSEEVERLKDKDEEETICGEAVVTSIMGPSSRSVISLRERERGTTITSDFSKTSGPLLTNHIMYEIVTPL